MEVATQRDRLDLRRWTSVLAYSAPLILTVVALALAATFVFLERIEPTYEAKAEVLLRPGSLARLSGSPESEDPTRLLTNEVARVSSNESRARVAQRTGIDLEVEASAVDMDSDVVEFRTRGSDPTVLAEDLNGWSDGYVELLDDEAEAIIGEFVESEQAALASAESELDTVLAPIAELDRQIEQLPAGDERAEAIDQREILAARTGSQVERLEDEIEDIGERLFGAQLVLLFQEETSAEVISRATVPTSPVRPNTRRAYLLALTCGLVGGAGLAVLRASIRPLLLRPSDLDDLGLPSPAASFRTRSASISDDAVRAVVGELLVLPPSSPVLLVSPSPFDHAKVASALARSAAEIGQTIVVVDAHIRSPQLLDGDGERQRGLTEVLAQSCPTLDAVVADGIAPGVDLLPAGLASEPPGSAGPSRWSAAINDLEAKYDLVLLIAPPLSEVPEGRVLAAVASTSIVVARRGHTALADLRQLHRTLEGAETQLGAVVWLR